MLLRQLFDRESYTYTYMLADEQTGQAAFIDPVAEQLDIYLQLLDQLDLELVLALDTHVHADHVTALGTLRERTGCKAIVGIEGEVDCATDCLADGKQLDVGSIRINVIYTPGHTDDSFTFAVNDHGTDYLFTGDTLFIRGTGRTDFQNGDPGQLYDSLHQKILTFPDEAIVYPAHDYKGWTVSTVGEEKRHNPRLQPATREAFIELMNGLDLPDPKMMDVAVPLNRTCGLGNG
jgi:sulfur dioxygenase